MATFDYNPITGNLDLVGSGGASYINGVVADSSLLPVTLGTPALDAVYLAKAGSGVWLINRKPAGLYVRVANNGNAADWTYLGAFPEVNADGNWELYNSTDPTKELKFDLSGLPTATTRTVNAPDGNGKMLVEGQSIGATTRASGAFTTLSANNGTVTTSTPALTVTQALNNAAVAFDLSRLDLSGTGSSNSTFINCVNNGAGVFSIRRTGVALGQEFIGSNGFRAIGGGNGGGQVILSSNGYYSFCDSTTSTFGTVDLLLRRDAAGILAQHNLANPQTFRLYNTTDAGLTNFERGFMRWSSNVLQIGTEKGGTGSARALEFQTDGVTRLDITTGGTVNISTSTGPFAWQGSTVLRPVDGNGTLRLSNNAQNDFNRLQFGGTTNAFPALKRSSTALQVRLADDSAFADFECGGSTFNSLMIIRNSSLLMLNGGSIRLQTSAGADTAEIARDAAGIVALRSGTTAHSFRVYNTSTSSNANFERANFRWASNEFIIDAEAGGTGTSLRGIKIGSATSSLLGFYGAVPVDRPATVADPTGGGTVDAEARTAINDIIDRLQELGLIA